jgi:hypothetical protein
MRQLCEIENWNMRVRDGGSGEGECWVRPNFHKAICKGFQTYFSSSCSSLQSVTEASRMGFLARDEMLQSLLYEGT